MNRLAPLILAAVLLAVWEAACRILAVPPYLLPMPSATGVEHDVCSLGIFSILTRQTRHDASMPRPGW